MSAFAPQIAADNAALTRLVLSIPEGYSEAIYNGERYSLSRMDYATGKSLKVFARHLGGQDFVSFNFYIVKGEGILKPCEMPYEKVVDFLEKAWRITFSPSELSADRTIS